MKKLVLLMLAVSALVFTSCSKDDDGGENPKLDQLTKKVETKIRTEAGKELKSIETTTYSYASNGYLKSSTIIDVRDRVEITGSNSTIVKETYKDEEIYEYNSKNQVSKKTSISYTNDVKDSDESATFKYNSEGFLTELKVDEEGKSTFEYNDKGLLIKENYNVNGVPFSTTYEYDANGILIEDPDEREKFFYSDKIDPEYRLFPEKFLLMIEPGENIKYLLSKITFTKNDGTTKVTEYKNTFKGEYLVKTVVDDSDQYGKDIITTEYFY